MQFTTSSFFFSMPLLAAALLLNASTASAFVPPAFKGVNSHQPVSSLDMVATAADMASAGQQVARPRKTREVSAGVIGWKAFAFRRLFGFLTPSNLDLSLPFFLSLLHSLSLSLLPPFLRSFLLCLLSGTFGGCLQRFASACVGIVHSSRRCQSP